MASGYYVKLTERIQGGVRVADGKVWIAAGPSADGLRAALRADAQRPRANGQPHDRTAQGVAGALIIVGVAFAAGLAAGWLMRGPR